LCRTGRQGLVVVTGRGQLGAPPSVVLADYEHRRPYMYPGRSVWPRRPRRRVTVAERGQPFAEEYNNIFVTDNQISY